MNRNEGTTGSKTRNPKATSAQDEHAAAPAKAPDAVASTSAAGGGGAKGIIPPPLEPGAEPTITGEGISLPEPIVPQPVPTVEPSQPVKELSDQQLYFNRELSWLDFNERVLELAEDPHYPLLERVKFLAIFASNLDEFFMKRVGGLQRQRAAKVTGRSIDGLTADEQLTLIHRKVRPMLDRQIACWYGKLHPELKKQGIGINRYADLTDGDKQYADDFFDRQVFPILTPLAVDPGHPFPFISNLSKSLGVMLEDETTGEQSFVRIKLPENLPRWVALPERTDDQGRPLHRFVPLEGVVGGNLEKLFAGMKVMEHHLFRVTRNADIELDEEDADDLLSMVEEELRRRRMARVVRLELPEGMGSTMRRLIIDGLGVAETDVYTFRGPIDMDDLFGLARVDRADLKFETWKPQVPLRLRDAEADIFGVIRSGDLLVHHPYESFAASVERFIGEAADDPKVLAIKMTLYRTSGDSPFVPALIRAAEAGKQVAVLVELKARFDEQRNVELAQKLEKSGVHVVYGIIGLKTHTKIAMTVRDEADGLRTYCHIGTGNYNSRTAELYTDNGLFTTDPGICADVIELFHHLTGRSVQREYRKLLVAPLNMRKKFLAMIHNEAELAKAGKPAQIAAKMNSLQDGTIINALYDASRAGVKIDLIVRGFCCLRPGVPGLSENIRVISILGRFLEHNRIFRFGNDGNPHHFIGSADWMVRNLDYRVEAITPVIDPHLKQELDVSLELALTKAGRYWELQPDGTWTRQAGPAGSGAAWDDPAPDFQSLQIKRYLKQDNKLLH